MLVNKKILYQIQDQKKQNRNNQTATDRLPRSQSQRRNLQKWPRKSKHDFYDSYYRGKSMKIKLAAARQAGNIFRNPNFSFETIGGGLRALLLGCGQARAQVLLLLAQLLPVREQQQLLRA